MLYPTIKLTGTVALAQPAVKNWLAIVLLELKISVVPVELASIPIRPFLAVF